MARRPGACPAERGVPGGLLESSCALPPASSPVPPELADKDTRCRIPDHGTSHRGKEIRFSGRRSTDLDPIAAAESKSSKSWRLVATLAFWSDNEIQTSRLRRPPPCHAKKPPARQLR